MLYLEYSDTIRQGGGDRVLHEVLEVPSRNVSHFQGQELHTGEPVPSVPA